MANHVTNTVTVTGPADDLFEFERKHFSAAARGVRGFDFNSIIPMPECLAGIVSGSPTHKGIEGLTGKPYFESFRGVSADIAASVSRSFPTRPMPTAEDLTDAEREAGTRALAAIAKCGYPTWYEWANDRWGTKWNAYHCQAPTIVLSASVPAVLTFAFDSAWDTPQPIWKALEATWPTLTFTVELSGEIDEETTFTFGPTGLCDEI